MARLRAAVEASALTLDDGRDVWVQAVRGWLGGGDEERAHVPAA
jgi:hypothetical protein